MSGTLYVNLLIISAKSGIENVINAAGRQRFLAQRILYIADPEVESAGRDVQQTADQIRTAAQFLVSDAVPSAYSVANVASLHGLYFAQDGLSSALESYLAAADAFAYGVDRNKASLALSSQRTLRTQFPELLRKLEDSVHQYRQIADAETRKLERIEIGIWLLGMAALLAEIIFIFMPLQGIMRRQLGLLVESAEVLGAIVGEAYEPIMVTDPSGRIVTVNRAFEAVTGYSRAEAVGATPRILSSGHHDKAFYRAMFESLGRDGVWRGQVRNRRKNGEVFVEELSIAALHTKNGDIRGYVAVFRDVTTETTERERLRRFALYDGLTGIPNRTLFMDRLEHAVTLAERDGSAFAVIFIDLNRFKVINDTLGHAVGDGVLKAVADRLTQAVRESDTVARLGGDEFVVLTPQIDTRGGLDVLLRRLHDVFETPIMVDNRSLSIGASIGAAIYPRDARSADELIRSADKRMYEKKHCA